MDYIIREILQEEYGLLEHFLYEAIFVPEGMAAPPESITKQPELQVYLTDFGEKKDDIGLVAEVDSKVVGAVSYTHLVSVWRPTRCWFAIRICPISFSKLSFICVN